MEPSVVRLKLPLPPTINKQYATVGKHRVLSWDAKRYKRDIIKRMRRLCISGQIPHSLVEAFRQGFVSLTLTFYFKTLLGRDLDGGLKITQDSLCEGLQINDNRVVELHLWKRVDAQDPHVQAELRPVPPSADFKTTAPTSEDCFLDLS